MSKPERFCLDGPTGIPEELMVTRYYESTDGQRHVDVPRPRDVAEALSRCSNEWFEVFLRAFQRKSPNRAMVVASAAESAQLKPDLSEQKAMMDLAAAIGVSEEALVGAVHGAGWQLLPVVRAILALPTDVTGGDSDPGFGVDPNDSARLLELRQVIDAIGWRNKVDEEGGDYLGRLRQIREELAQQDAVLGKTIRQARTIRQQRVELRRFNREARARKEAAGDLLAAERLLLKHGFLASPQLAPGDKP